MSTAYLDDLVSKRMSAWKAQEALLNTIHEENRDATPEEREQIERMDADFDRYLAEEKRVTERLALLKDADGSRPAEVRVETATVGNGRSERDRLVAAVRSAMNGGSDGWDSNIGHIPEYRALQSAGGSALGTTFTGQVIVYARDLTPMLRDDLFNVIPTNAGGPLTFTRYTADQSTSGTLTAEAGGITEADPTLSTFQLDAYKYAVTTLISYELIQDSEIDISGYIARGAAREMASVVGTALTTGDGSSKPNGIVTAAANGGTASGTTSNTSLDTFFGPADLIDLKWTRNLDYLGTGTYLVSKTAAAKIRKMRDSNKQFIWQPSLQAGMAGEFDSSPIVINPAMAAVASASKSVIFGDLSRYFVRMLPTRVDVSRDYKFASDQVAVRTIMRVDGDIADANAIAYLVSANT